MNNEEKILAMLEALTGKVDGIDSRLAKVEATQAAQGEQLAAQGEQLAALTQKVDCMDSRLEKVETMQEELRSSVNRLSKKVDHDIIPYVKLLDEDYNQAKEQPVLVHRIDSLEGDVRLLNNPAKNHGQRLLALEKIN